MHSSRPVNETEWRAALEALPVPPTSATAPGRLPAFFFGHGSPTLLLDAKLNSRFSGFEDLTGSSSRLARFLSDFGPALLRKYNPKAIVVFSAHWETLGETLGALITLALLSVSTDQG